MLNAVIAILTYVLDYNMLRVLKYTNMRLFNLSGSNMIIYDSLRR